MSKAEDDAARIAAEQQASQDTADQPQAEEFDLVDITGKRGMHTLMRPILFEGATVGRIKYDFTEMDGRTMIRLAGTLTGPMTDRLVLAANIEYQAAIFAAASQYEKDGQWDAVPIELIISLKAPDFVEACAQAQLFLLGGSDRTPETSPKI